MAVERDRAYSAFNFRVELGDGTDPTSVRAGFQEVTGLGMEITVAEYRAGNYRDNAPQKITGSYKVPDVTLKRGLIGDPTTLYSWIDRIRNGSQAELRTVTVQLMAEDRSGPVQEWKLTGARPTKYTGPSLNGKGTDVAVEELVLACERIDLI
jgi:phage tail-like protein